MPEDKGLDPKALEAAERLGNFKPGDPWLAAAICAYLDASSSSSKWRAEDLVPGHAYESQPWGTVRYIGLDHYCGETTHEFEGARMVAGNRRFVRSDKLNDFLAPKDNASNRRAPVAREGWQPMSSAPRNGYIIGAWRDGSRWHAAEVFLELDDWVDVNSDRIRKPTHWMPLPPAPTEDQHKGER